MSSFLDLYDPLDIIGNGSFGIIRKVRRKSDGLVSSYHSVQVTVVRSSRPDRSLLGRSSISSE
jgi:hypothetical protein